MNNRLGKKAAIITLLAAFLNLSYTPALADTTILGGGAAGGVITSLGGANVDPTSNADYAKINITGNGNTILWNTFNIGSEKTLEFIFSQAGQVALNKVMGGQMSTIAGTLTTSGAAGRLIISNPAGMLFTDGATVNANSLILTTKDVNWDGNLNGKLELTDNASVNAITINSAKFDITDDLNIIASNIEFNNAQDIVANKDIRLITADGVNFIAAGIENPDNVTGKGEININNSKIEAVKDNLTGKIYIVSGDVNVTNSSIKNANIKSEGKIVVTGKKDYSNSIDNSKLTAKTNIKTSNLKSINNSTLELTEKGPKTADGKANNNEITISSNEKNPTEIKNSTLDGRYIKAESSVISNSILKSTKDITVNKATINDSTIDSGFKVIAKRTNIKDTTITGTNAMTFAKIDPFKENDPVSVLNNVTITLNTNSSDSELKNYNNKMNGDASHGTIDAINIHLNDAIINDSTISAPKICANRTTIENSTLTAFYEKTLTKGEKISIGEMSLIGATLKNSSAIAKDFVNDRNDVITRDNSITNAIIENSTLTAKSGNLLINKVNYEGSDYKNTRFNGDAKLSGAIVNAANSVFLKDVDAASGTADYSVNINNTNNVEINNAHNFKVKAAAADITINNSDITANDLTVTNNLSVKDSNLNALNVSGGKNITLEGVNSGSVNIANVANVVIKNSLSAADASTPTIENLSQGRTAIVDYNSSKYTAADLENKITGNKYGENQRISYISGDVNISNATNIDIINTAITGNLNESAYTGEVNLITSYIGGSYTPIRANGETSVYQPYIVGLYIPYYMGVDTDTNNNDKFKFDNDNDKTKMGSAINTELQRQFTPKGFAASDDEIANRIDNVLSSSKSGRNHSIITTQRFIAD